MEEVVETKETEEGVADRKAVMRKVLPGYVIVKMVMTDVSWFVVRNTRGVTSFVGPGSKPVPLTDKEVIELGIEKLVVDVDFAVGDSVKICSGPLDGFIGVVEEINMYATINTHILDKFLIRCDLYCFLKKLIMF